MIRLAVRVRRSHAELVLAELIDLAPGGVEEVDVGDDTVEYAVYGAPGELPSLPDVHAAVGGALVDVSTSEVRDDWAERWRDFHRPVLIDAPAPAPACRGGAGVLPAVVPALRIRPPWERALVHAPDAPREIVIDPGQAFGTGGHATTHLCLELLLALAAGAAPAAGTGPSPAPTRPSPRAPGFAPLIDLGTGSGVLAIAAALLGFAPVLALDFDPESVRAATANAQANGLKLDVRRFDLRGELLPLGQSPWSGETIVLANLVRPLLIDLARALPLAPAGLILGGLLESEADEVSSVFIERAGMHECERRHRGGWAALWLAA